MFILRSPHRAYDTRYLLICNDEFSQKIGGKIDVHTLKDTPFISTLKRGKSLSKVRK